MSEIILIDDGSNDGTYIKIKALSQSFDNIVEIRFSRNFGKKRQFLQGLPR